MNGFIPRTLALALVAGLTTGCVTTSTSLFHSGPETAPTGTPLFVQTMWEQRVVAVPDVVNQGRPLQGLACRLYLFETYGVPIQTKGSLEVDCVEVKSDGSKVMLEKWEIDPLTMSRVFRKDSGIGWGYTVFLPWTTFRPDVRRLEMQVKFVPEKGMPLFSQPALITLQYDETPQPTITSRIVPAAAKQP